MTTLDVITYFWVCLLHKTSLAFYCFLLLSLLQIIVTPPTVYYTRHHLLFIAFYFHLLLSLFITQDITCFLLLFTFEFVTDNCYSAYCLLHKTSLAFYCFLLLNCYSAYCLFSCYEYIMYPFLWKHSYGNIPVFSRFSPSLLTLVTLEYSLLLGVEFTRLVNQPISLVINIVHAYLLGKPVQTTTCAWQTTLFFILGWGCKRFYCKIWLVHFGYIHGIIKKNFYTCSLQNYVKVT